MQLGAGLAFEEKLVAVVELFGRHMRSAVGVDVAPDLAGGRRGDSGKTERQREQKKPAAEIAHAVILRPRL